MINSTENERRHENVCVVLVMGAGMDYAKQTKVNKQANTMPPVEVHEVNYI